MTKLKIFCPIFLLIIFIAANVRASDSCSGKTNCGSCIQTKECAWCKEPNFGDNPRCFNFNSTNKCSESSTVAPKNNLTIIKDESLTGKTKTSDSNPKVVQIRPQEVKIKLRISEFHREIFQKISRNNLIPFQIRNIN